MFLKEIVRNCLQKSKLGEEIWRILHLINIHRLQLLSDEEFFTKSYIATHGKKPDFNNPKTFDEKQLWLKMYYRNPLCTKCSDKYLVREFVKENGLEHILNPIYGVYDSVKDINWSDLPERFYIKANHMSACNVRCNNLSTFNKKAAAKKLNRGMKHDYSLDSREWNYRDIERKIIAEAIIENNDGSGLIDYRFLCSYGNCEYIFVDIDTADENGTHRKDARRNVYDKNFDLLDVKISRENFEPSLVEKPKNFEKMIEYAEILSKNFPFCRVDFYNIDGKIIFGEITFFHAGGLSKISPDSWELKLGDFINLDKLLKNKCEGLYVSD